MLGGEGDGEVVLDKPGGPGLLQAIGVGEEEGGTAQVLLYPVDAGLEVGEEPGLVVLPALAPAALDAVLLLVVGGVGVGAELHQSGAGHLPAHVPGEEAGDLLLGVLDDEGDHRLGLVLLKEGVGQGVVAVVPIVKGEHDRPLGQRLPGGQLAGQDGDIAVAVQPLQVLPQADVGEHPVVAGHSLGDKVVVHQHVQLGVGRVRIGVRLRGGGDNRGRLRRRLRELLRQGTGAGTDQCAEEE